MSDDRLVSVVIASYNMAQYLPLAVRSVLAQTYRNIEVHVVDDGSTDTTKKIVSEFEDDIRFNYHWQSNQGQASAKNRGVREARGEYIAFLDADDMWVPRKLEMQVPLLERAERIGVVYSPFTCMDAEGKPLRTPGRRCHRGRISGLLLIDNFIGFNTSVVRRQCFEELGMFDESLPMGIDYDLWLRFSTRYEFDFVEEPTMYYRVWPGQMSTNFKKRFDCAFRIMNRFLSENVGLVERPVVQEAWAHTFAARGDCFRRIDDDKWNSARDYLRALRYKPAYPAAWKGLVKLALNWES